MEQQVPLDHHTPEPVAPGQFVEYAQWMRLLSAILDGLVTIPVAFFVIYNILETKSLVLAFVVSLAPVVYKVLMEGLFGATIGKMICGLKVLTRDFQPISITHAFVRYWPWLIAAVAGFISMYLMLTNPEINSFHGMDIESLMAYGAFADRHSNWMLTYLPSLPMVAAIIVILTNKEGRGLHDMAAGTVVVFKKSLG